METIAIPVTISPDILIALNETEQELKDYFQSAIAMLLFQEKKLTFGKAVQLSGLSRYAFEQFLTQNDIPFSNTTANEVFADLAKLNTDQ